ncbi:Mss4-like protein [Triangularia verruculosa]|uniref:Mss4-like protein n=1 Tax=Triangularia verruculosa TaxID=2587418 RepID=A0AAN6XDY6_9PEZI|nr:Mss4-like protein [Triangularia verruculosa]
MSSSSEPTQDEKKKNEETYPCSCHCGSIAFAVTLSPPLPEQSVMECNCSICRRAGYLLVYPPVENVKFLHGSEARLSRYKFNSKTRDHLFCGYCGASLGIDFHGFRHRGYGISVRAFDGIDLDALTYKKGDGKEKIPPYTDLSGVQWALDQKEKEQAEHAEKGEN